MRYLLVAILAAVLAACSTTSEDIQKSPAEKGSLDVARPYSAVYEYIGQAVAQCFPDQGTVASHTSTHARELEPGKFGRIEAFRGGVPGERVMLSVDVKATETGAHIDYYSDYYSDYYGVINLSLGRSVRPLIQDWADGHFNGCGRRLPD